jgi:hypothetical protein
MKLKLEELAPYLPFKLKCFNQHLPDTKMVVEELIGISNHITWSGIFNARHGSNHTPICGIKPILKPLSDLTKEIEVDGKKFIPLKKIHELDETNSFDDKEKSYKLIFIDKVISVEHNKYELLGKEDFVLKYVVETSNLGNFIYSFTYDPEIRRFAKRNETYKQPLGIGFQIDMFNKLFEWHFDVFGLIEKGLAINKNTL